MSSFCIFAFLSSAGRISILLTLILESAEQRYASLRPAPSTAPCERPTASAYVSVEELGSVCKRGGAMQHLGKDLKIAGENIKGRKAQNKKQPDSR